MGGGAQAMASVSISKSLLYEKLLNIARSLEYAAETASGAFNGGRDVEESYRRVREISEEAVAQYFKFLDFLADGRMGLIDNVSLYLRAAMSIARAAQKVEASLYRLLILGGGGVPGSLAGLARKAAEAASELSAMLLVMSGASEEKARVAREKFARIVKLEGEADEEYRRGLRSLLSMEGEGAARLVILKDAMEYLEECVDEIFEAANHLNVTLQASG